MGKKKGGGYKGPGTAGGPKEPGQLPVQNPITKKYEWSISKGFAEGIKGNKNQNV